MKKTAVVLFNLGGPDTPKAVRPFLFNLFNDAAIIRVPQPLRFLIAALISRRRAPIARAIYAQMGGGSPILPNTAAQARNLDSMLNADPHHIYKSFIAMRYWHPFADETARQVKDFAPDEIILLPLYPQFSTTTTASSFKDWARAAQKNGLDSISAKTVCCYPREGGFIRALAATTRTAYVKAAQHGTPRILFSAHGLPEKIVAAGDPYPAQCAMTVAALRAELGIDNLDSVLCYQSRVGPLAWIKPATDDEVRRAGAEARPLVIVPIAFVSDHSETLVEINIEYRHLAKESGVPAFFFVPAVGSSPDFIAGLVQLVRQAEAEKTACLSGERARLCSPRTECCPCVGG
ncbi:MAG: ferrochelatase [Alphaproteobacteria bacterium]|nr:ferrochelatase [Alphaproteobacteria bacterium]